MIKKPGFTLIELLVVIAIIAVLMAILIPALGRVRDQAHTIGCRSNLKQYGVALRMYLDDNSLKFPDSKTWLKSASSSYVHKGETPDGVMWPYLRATDVHMCRKFAMVVKGTSWADTAVSYSMNSYLGNSGEIWSSWLGSNVTGVKKETQVYNSAMVIVFTEENPWVIPGYSNYGFNDTFFTVGNKTRQIDNYATYHNTSGDFKQGGANMVFVDGHVGFLLRRNNDLDVGFRLAWPKKTIPYS